MPARTLSPLVAADRATLSPPHYHAHPLAYPRRSSVHQDDLHSSDFHLPDYYAPLDGSGRPYASAMHTLVSHNPLTTGSYAHTLRHNQWNAFTSLPLPLPVQPPAVSGWLPHPPTLVRMASPPNLHAVWIVDCRSCGMFLTNRGMKAVLLLRPHVPLYSTDALPVNCSAQAMTATASSPSRSPAASDAATPSSPQAVPASSRTCECLTQTLWCHGCGTGVGYMIVVPCIRCTSSTTVNNRTTNGHRFVFYSSEIAASERHHVAGESGIVSPAFSPRISTSPHQTSPSVDFGTRATHNSPHVLGSPRIPSTPTRRRHSNASLLDSPSHMQNHNILDPPASPSVLSSPPPLVPVTPSSEGRTRSSSNSSVQRLEPLKAGDVLYWHHLVRHGEIPAVADDPRARNPDTSPSSAAHNTTHVRQARSRSSSKAETTARKPMTLAGR